MKPPETEFLLGTSKNDVVFRKRAVQAVYNARADPFFKLAADNS